MRSTRRAYLTQVGTERRRGRTGRCSTDRTRVYVFITLYDRYHIMPWSELTNIKSSSDSEIVLFAVLAGLACSVVAGVNYLRQTGPELAFLPVFFSGVATGYIFTQQEHPPRDFGIVIGLFASIPVVWQFYTVVTAVSTFDQPTWFTGSQLVLAVTVTLLLVLLLCLTGGIGAYVGDRFKLFHRNRS